MTSEYSQNRAESKELHGQATGAGGTIEFFCSEVDLRQPKRKENLRERFSVEEKPELVADVSREESPTVRIPLRIPGGNEVPEDSKLMLKDQVVAW